MRPQVGVRPEILSLAVAKMPFKIGTLWYMLGRCQQSAVSANSRIKDLRFGKGTVRYVLNPERARDERRTVVCYCPLLVSGTF